ncbi:MAG TPA: sulfite dehydrogenase [Gemmatimonadaceae bacterium]|nr:sulfite dehydrogenase [Gemmatimonadaceae bacterium]
MSDASKPISRRTLLAGATLAAGGVLLEKSGLAQSTSQAPPVSVPADPGAVPGGPTTPVSARSPFETPARTPAGIITGPAYSPLQEFTGTITPSDLVFERHHAGVALIDPKRHKLLVTGLVDRSMIFTLDDLERFPSVSRVHFLECSGNGRAAYREPKPEMTPQIVDGLTANGEWTGVPLATLLREVGVKREATWFLAEGGDASKLSRSIPIDKAWDDALVVYAFNGERLRPANGYPVRLLLPGFEANTNVKWLRRIKLMDQANMSRDETAKYTDPLPDGTARQFSLVLDVKSLITRPAHPARLAKGWVEISGLAWSGRGKIARVDVSTDGGATWTAAELQPPIFTKAHTRFRLPWEWKGGAATLVSRAWDETGATQPTRAEFERVRGRGTDFHFNHMRSWTIRPDGSVVFGESA